MDKKTIAYILIGGGAAVLLYMLLKKKDASGSTTSGTPVNSLASALSGNTAWTPDDGGKPTQEQLRGWMDQHFISLGWHQNPDGTWSI